WEMAEKTAHDVLARMALVPRVLEARGLDVTPGMITRLRGQDDAAADILEVILREEVAHVAAGSRWFRWCCARAGIEPEPRFRARLPEDAGAVLLGPFNIDAGSAAGFSDDELAALQQLSGGRRSAGEMLQAHPVRIHAQHRALFVPVAEHDAPARPAIHVE